MNRIQSAGALPRVGVKALLAVDWVYQAAALRAGARTMRRAASKMSGWGRLMPPTVATSLEQVLAVGAAAVQELRRLARELIFAAGETPLAGKVVPGEVPVRGLARLAALATALAMPWVLVADAPRRAPGLRNWARAQTLVTVVTSLRIKLEPGLRLSQRPRVEMKVMAELALKAPTLPPRATR